VGASIHEPTVLPFTVPFASAHTQESISA
jgi:hypothetical protein